MLNITGKNKILAVIGNPIEHSLSPQLHNGVISQLNANGIDCNYTYIPLKMSIDHVEFGVKGLKALGIRGCNVTVPFKEAVIPYLDEIDDYAKKIGAVNTISLRDNKLVGFNTDALGFINSVKSKFSNFSFKNKAIAILGAGGSSKAICMALTEEPIKSINILNRSINRASQLQSHLQKLSNIEIQAHTLTTDNHSILNAADIIINTTSVGMHPNNSRSPLTSHQCISQKHLVIDIIYNPFESKLLYESKTKGALTMNGLGMLAGQAALYF